MKVYLAGKMDASGNWRDYLIGHATWNLREEMPSMSSQYDIFSWPTKNYLIQDVSIEFEFTGPYRVHVPARRSKYTGKVHGNEVIGQHGTVYDEQQQQIAIQCLERIHQSDVVFAVLNTQDAFATYVEIGYAIALGKFVAIVSTAPEKTFDPENSWFAGRLANYYACVARATDSIINTHFKAALQQYTSNKD